MATLKKAAVSVLITLLKETGSRGCPVFIIFIRTAPMTGCLGNNIVRFVG